MLPSLQTIALTEPAQHIVQVTLNRPEAANAISTQLARDLLAVTDFVAAGQDAVRCVILSGAGERHFCAGADLKERDGMTDAQWRAQHLIFERMFHGVLNSPVPWIAAVNGAAFGGGCELALGCDFIYAAPHARFALTETRLGIMPGGGGTQTLPRAVGERRAKELIMTARPFDADEAVAWGMANRVCPAGAVLDETLATAIAIAANGPIAVRQAKHAIHYGLQMDLTGGLMFEIEAYHRLVGTEDRLEGVRAFNEKRRPDFKGR
jgi:enoyl-CoA hydratase